MRDSSWLDWPFFDDAHRTLAHEADAWCAQSLGDVDHHDADAACRQLVKALGEAGWLRYAVPSGPGGAWGGALPEVDSRAVCILRSEEHTSELQSPCNLVCRLLLEKKKKS